ncbi:hypothetical protein [Brachyspira catarrhinii]|uniref:TRASH domain-containing protein n=1 Tax=Brachyspira catarrhinii TaxID=2528966 RepID=A0ABY2TSY6_9SPIR|nr:hypothetical protein [Brachyspira catarrhinii]TKZ34802.1 hypothetical protein EZH24_07585 [Brachyspira catarrhinii]
MIKYKLIQYKLMISIDDENTKRCGNLCEGENSNYCNIYKKHLKKDGNTSYYLRCKECIQEFGEDKLGNKK